MDFTLSTYRHLLLAFRQAGYQAITFADYCEGLRPERFVILRHDVDAAPRNAWNFAQMEAQEGLRGSYYFRSVPQSWNETIIQNMAALGHEVGFHYESLSSCKGDVKAAIKDFEVHLKALRALCPVKTIAMHGSPRSPYDSKALWKSYDYRDYGLIGEPYLDVDFERVFYLSDTGRRWDGWQVSVRDKVARQANWQAQGLTFRHTKELVAALREERFPAQVMMTFHPQRWHAAWWPWVWELLWQNTKNVVKRFLVKA